MADSWDADDFVPTEVEQAKAAETVVDDRPGVPNSQPTKPKARPGDRLREDPVTALASQLGRNLTPKEIEEAQRRSDLSFAEDLLGQASDGTYSTIRSKDEFEVIGEKVGIQLATRHKAAHYIDMIAILLVTLTKNLDSTSARRIATVAKTIADKKKEDEDRAKKQQTSGHHQQTAAAAKTNAAGAKTGGKASLKVGKGGSAYDDYDPRGDGTYDDLEDDFM